MLEAIKQIILLHRSYAVALTHKIGDGPVQERLQRPD
jgi:hypothetical protein